MVFYNVMNVLWSGKAYFPVYALITKSKPQQYKKPLAFEYIQEAILSFLPHYKHD